MEDWIVKYMDETTNREVQSHPMRTRGEAIALACDREREGCVVLAIEGPKGEECWSTKV
jgi:hypothetical protein